MFSKLWKNLRLQNQILIIQSLIVAIVFAILISSCIYLVQLFSGFIKHELLEKLVLKSMVSTIKTAILRVDIIGLTVYNQFRADRQHLKNVYAFQIKNNIRAYSQLEDCLQSQHSQQFYSYQFCYGLYGQTDGLLNLTQIRNYIALQNQIIPFIRRKEINAYYNIQYNDQQTFFSQYEGIYMSKIDKPLIDPLQEMKQYKIIDYFKQMANQEGQFFLSLEVVPDSEIIVGTLINQTDGLYYKLTQSEKYFNQRSLSVLGSGLIITDTRNFDAFGNRFQNASYSGFDQDQFQKIKSFADKKGIVNKECYQQLSNEILCLLDVNNEQKLVFSRNIDKTGANPYYIIVIVDIIFLNRIEDEFNEQLQSSINDVFTNIGIRYIIAFVVSVILQVTFIYKLNKPLETLKSVANYHINNYQNQRTIQMISKGQKIKNITQKLASAFYNLINLTNTCRDIKQQLQNSNKNEYRSISGILRRESQKVSIKIRRIVKKRTINHP